jgi:prepilin-type N-terminal cleavage/methylation domain-containing protein
MIFPQWQKGFTLLELMVALTISAMVALVGSSAMSMALDFYQRNIKRSASREDIKATERILRHEWAGRGLLARSDGNSLEFITIHPVLSQLQPEVTVATVRYACEVSDNGDLNLLHSMASIRGDGPERGQPAQWKDSRILASGLSDCAFSLLTEERRPGGVTQPRWQPHWDESKPAPQLMQLLLARHDRMPPMVFVARGHGSVK